MTRNSRCLTGLYPWQGIVFVSLGYQQDGIDSMKLKELLFVSVMARLYGSDPINDLNAVGKVYELSESYIAPPSLKAARPVRRCDVLPHFPTTTQSRLTSLHIYQHVPDGWSIIPECVRVESWD